jgi:hypothetical protein
MKESVRHKGLAQEAYLEENSHSEAMIDRNSTMKRRVAVDGRSEATGTAAYESAANLGLAGGSGPINMGCQ